MLERDLKNVEIVQITLKEENYFLFSFLLEINKSHIFLLGIHHSPLIANGHL